MTIQLTGVNRTGCTLLSLSQGTAQDFTWSPYGNSPARTGQSALLPGFNGERADPLTGVTHLGNGYRAYNPSLMRFTCPDSHSPFGNGGVNPYAYCSGDPINQTDPSGHGPALWTVLAGTLAGEISAADAATYTLVTAAMVAQRNARKIAIGTGIASLAISLQVASNKTAESNPQASRALEWAARGLGITVGVSLTGLGAYKGARKLMRMISQPSRELQIMMHDAAGAAGGQEITRSAQGSIFDIGYRKHPVTRCMQRITQYFVSDYLGSGEDVIVVHSPSSREGVGIGGQILGPDAFIDFFNNIGIDLRANQRALHLVTCCMANDLDVADGFVNILAEKLGRTIITYGQGQGVVVPGNMLERLTRHEALDLLLFDPIRIEYTSVDFVNMHDPGRRAMLQASIDI